MILLTCDQKLTIKASFVIHTRRLKEDNGGTKTQRRSTESVEAVRLKSSGRSGGQERIYGGKDLWNKWVLSLEWKRDEVMDGVMVVTDDEGGWRNEAN